ncbi:hypothetical protein MHYP_G00353540 [Metynnis hypsauchen]
MKMNTEPSRQSGRICIFIERKGKFCLIWHFTSLHANVGQEFPKDVARLTSKAKCQLSALPADFQRPELLPPVLM